METIELKQFIKEALLNVTDGVKEANEKSNRFKMIGVKHESGIDGNFVDFDVSVVINESSGSQAEGKAGVFLSVLSAGINSRVDQANLQQNTHRLTFKVYISEKEIERS